MCVYMYMYMYVYISIYIWLGFFTGLIPHITEMETTELPSGGQAQVVEAAGPADDDAEQSKGHRAKVLLDDGTGNFLGIIFR